MGLVATNPQSSLDDLIDQTGFIDRFKNNADVKPEYRGRGVGLGLVSCFDKDKSEKLKQFEIRRLKNYALLNWMDLHVSEMEIRQLNVDVLKDLVTTFRDNFGKNNRKSRNDTRGNFIELATAQNYTEFQGDEILALSSGSETESESGKEIKRLTVDLFVSKAETDQAKQEKLQERQEKLQERHRADQLAARLAEVEALLATRNEKGSTHKRKSTEIN